MRRESAILSELKFLVWSIVCFDIDRSFRCQGISHFMSRAAVEFTISNGAKIIEGYPVKPKNNDIPDVFAYVGLASAYRKVGFLEVIRRAETRLIMRFYVD